MARRRRCARFPLPSNRPAHKFLHHLVFFPFQGALSPGKYHSNVGVRGFAEWREFAAAGALQSLEINKLWAALHGSLASAAQRTQMTMEHSQIGSRFRARRAGGKVAGAARYVGRPDFPGNDPRRHRAKLLARGKILDVRFGDDIPWNEFTIVTARDIPGKNCIAR